MARRSATNQRYQKDAGGSTRKSAASAKPKRGAGESAASAAKKKTRRKDRPKLQLNPDTPEFKYWRKIWMGLLLSAVVTSIGAFALRESPPWGNISLVIAYACLFGAFFVDMVKIRKIRKEWRTAQKKESDSKTSKGKG